MLSIFLKPKLSLAILITYTLIIPRAHGADTGSVTITGQVPISCDVVVTEEAGASNIADISDGASNLLVATITEDCNDPDGYSLSLVGTNSASFTGLFTDSVSNDTHPFTINYDGSNLTSTTITDTVSGANISKELRINFGADNSLTPSVAATYAETLTFSIVAK